RYGVRARAALVDVWAVPVAGQLVLPFGVRRSEGDAVPVERPRLGHGLQVGPLEPAQVLLALNEREVHEPALGLGQATARLHEDEVAVDLDPCGLGFIGPQLDLVDPGVDTARVAGGCRLTHEDGR